jgi:molybdopterin-guanine dinucleotide biosynthesis protein A
MIAGIFVGGQSTRMGGFPKGRLTAEDSGEPLIVRTSRLLIALGVTPLLVGAAEAYADLVPALARLGDRPEGVGPLGGLGALLQVAEGEHVLALACDMPFLSQALLEKLITARADEDVLAAKGAGGFWEPFCARYRVSGVMPALSATLADQERSFRALFTRVSLAELPLDANERALLRDWDTQEDMRKESQHEP